MELLELAAHALELSHVGAAKIVGHQPIALGVGQPLVGLVLAARGDGKVVYGGLVAIGHLDVAGRLGVHDPLGLFPPLLGDVVGSGHLHDLFALAQRVHYVVLGRSQAQFLGRSHRFGDVGSGLVGAKVPHGQVVVDPVREKGHREDRKAHHSACPEAAHDGFHVAKAQGEVERDQHAQDHVFSKALPGGERDRVPKASAVRNLVEVGAVKGQKGKEGHEAGHAPEGEGTQVADQHQEAEDHLKRDQKHGHRKRKRLQKLKVEDVGAEVLFELVAKPERVVHLDDTRKNKESAQDEADQGLCKATQIHAYKVQSELFCAALELLFQQLHLGRKQHVGRRKGRQKGNAEGNQFHMFMWGFFT